MMETQWKQRKGWHAPTQQFMREDALLVILLHDKANDGWWYKLVSIAQSVTYYFCLMLYGNDGKNKSKFLMFNFSISFSNYKIGQLLPELKDWSSLINHFPVL